MDSVWMLKVRGPNAEIFKRLFQSGSRAKFWGMAWEGDLGLINALHYQEDVENALNVSSSFANQVSNATTETKVVLAHSLGNMVVSSAIQDHDLSVSKYFMLDAAVASECYNPNAFDETTSTSNPMMNVNWIGYDARTWCSDWHKLFTDPNDDRSSLTWRNRFNAVTSVACNCYSSGDETLEIYTSGTLSTFTGTIFHVER
jgi:hypothetical protein